MSDSDEERLCDPSVWQRQVNEAATTSAAPFDFTTPSMNKAYMEGRTLVLDVAATKVFSVDSNMDDFDPNSRDTLRNWSQNRQSILQSVTYNSLISAALQPADPGAHDSYKDSQGDMSITSSLEAGGRRVIRIDVPEDSAPSEGTSVQTERQGLVGGDCSSASRALTRRHEEIDESGAGDGDTDESPDTSEDGEAWRSDEPPDSPW